MPFLDLVHVLSGFGLVEDVAVLLRAAGLRVTASRLAVYGAVAAAPYSDAGSVTRVVRAWLGSVSGQGVYDALRVLTERGLLRRIEPAGSAARYEVRTGDNHHHLVCRSCGVTVDVDCVVGAAPCLTPAGTSGFVLDEAEVVFWGACPACLQHHHLSDQSQREPA